MHFGGNLISFPFSGCYDIEQVISSEVNEYIDKIVGEGVSAISNPIIGWLGSLDQLCGGQGYWIIVNEAINFQYSPGNQTIRLNKDIIN